MEFRAVVLALVGLGSALPGCRDVLNTDDFAVTESVEPCGPLEVRAASGCVPVGVTSCGTGFGKDDRGGCEPKFSAQQCDVGKYVHPGLSGCSPITSVCPAGPFGSVAGPIGRVVYVGATLADAPHDAPWYATLDEAFSGNPSGDLTIALAKGTHAAHVDVANRTVKILGACATETVIVSNGGEPVIAVGPGGDSSSFEELTLEGSGPGVAVSGAKNVQFTAIWAHALGGPGFMFDDSQGWSADAASYKETSGHIERCFVQEASDMGIGVYGASVELVDVEISNTRPLPMDQRAYGLVVRPSPKLDLPQGANVKDVRHPGLANVSRSLIDHMRGAAVLIEGSDVTIESTLIQGVEADLARHGRGIDIRAHTPGRLRSPTHLELQRSIIQDVYDVGLRVWNADSVHVEDSVIRNVGAGMVGRCLGNAIRARYDLVRDIGRDIGLTVENSLFEGTRQAALHVEGGKTTLSGSIVRDSRAEPCRNDFGDGVAMYSSPTGPATTEVSRTRIEDAARAGIASYDSSIALDSVQVECGASGIAEQGGSVTTNGAWCGCRGRLQRCKAVRAGPASLFGGSKCQANDDTVCYRGCSGSVAVPQSILTQATIWPYDHDEVRSAVSDENGCYEIEGLPPNERVMMSIVQDEHVPGLGMVAPLSADSVLSHRAELLRADFLQLGVAFFGPADFRRVYVLLARLCQTPKVYTDANPGICKGLPGLTGTLAPGPVGGLAYFSPINLPDPTLTSTSGADVVFTEVAPGAQDITFDAPDGRQLRCTPDSGGLGWMEGPNTMRVNVEEGFTMVAAEVNCEVSP